MTTKPQQCLKKYGNPNLLATQQKWFTLWIVPEKLLKAFSHVYFTQVGTVGFPKKIFVNKDFLPLLEKGLNNVVDRGLSKLLESWDGCFIIRKQRGSDEMSIHSWAAACDVNAEKNPIGKKPTMPPELVKCFTDAGCIWGGTFKGKRVDGMHFEIASI